MSGAEIVREIGRQASGNTKYHVLYGFYFLGFKKSQLSEICGKSKPTIANWIHQYETDGTVGRKAQVEMVYRKFGHDKIKYLLHLYDSQPVLYLAEAKNLFFKQFGIQISTSSVHTILQEAGLTWKVLERHTIQIQLKDVLRFCNELSTIRWSWEQLVFLDEVSFDGMGFDSKKRIWTER